MFKVVPRNCWCQKGALLPFSEDYAACSSCLTLISQKGLSNESLLVKDDEADFYGKNYWLAHQTSDLTQPDIIERVRSDLPERCAYWLASLLKYKLPPARVLELGCAHGGFVAMMRAVGYDAFGLELSPWIADFAKKSFDIPIMTGPIETQNIEPQSLDVIILMDVLEHLPDPYTTMQACLKLLKQDGILLIQTPCHLPNLSYDDLKKTNHSFLIQLKEDEHLYLFNKNSIQAFFKALDVSHFAFEPAIFAHYDMFFAASRFPIILNAQNAIADSITATVQGRFIGAILDARKKIETLQEESLNRFKQIEQLTTWLQASEKNNNFRDEQIKTIDDDRTARGTQIDTLTKELKLKETAQTSHLKQINELTQQVKIIDADRTARDTQIETLTNELKLKETAQISHLKQIDELTQHIKIIDADRRTARGAQIDTLTKELKLKETTQTSHLKQIEELTQHIKTIDTDRTARGAQIEQLTAWLKESEHDRAERLKVIETLSEQLTMLHNTKRDEVL